MHYAAIMSELFFVDHAKAPSRRASKHSALRNESLPKYVAGAWRNWWTMSVEEPASPTAAQTRGIGARGRMPGV